MSGKYSNPFRRFLLLVVAGAVGGGISGQLISFLVRMGGGSRDLQIMTSMMVAFIVGAVLALIVWGRVEGL